MAKSTRNTGKPWAPNEVKEMKSLLMQNTPTRVIGLKLGRTEAATRQKAHLLGLSLRPTNRSPRN
jgi:hypothetical protein